jgi:hypothetical protein
MRAAAILMRDLREDSIREGWGFLMSSSLLCTMDPGLLIELDRPGRASLLSWIGLAGPAYMLDRLAGLHISFN